MLVRINAPYVGQSRNVASLLNLRHTSQPAAQWKLPRVRGIFSVFPHRANSTLNRDGACVSI